MRCVVISLPDAAARQASIDREFRKVGLDYDLWPAIDGSRLSAADRSAVNHVARARLGLFDLDDPTIACLLSHLAALRHFVESGDGLAAVFEDDARLDPNLPAVLSALEGEAGRFDVVKLQRRWNWKTYLPVCRILPSHTIGRVRFHDIGGYGYVITRGAARQLLECRVRHWEIDQLIGRFWDTGLKKVLYVDPPVVFHDGALPSHIAGSRSVGIMEHRRLRRRNPLAEGRRLWAMVVRQVRRGWHWRRVRRADRAETEQP